MAVNPSKSFSTKSLEFDEEFSEFCENFQFSNLNVSIYKIKSQFPT